MKTAIQIVKENDNRDEYHTCQFKAALEMIRSGLPNWVYGTQWSTGGCLFYSPDREHTCIVKASGEVRF